MVIDFLNKKYKVIYADPPWPIDNIRAKKAGWKKIQEKYNTMSLEEIKALPITEIADDGCSLFLWTTHTFLHVALDLIKAWGFKYHCVITWDKGGGFTLCGFNRRTELCIFAYKNRLEIEQKGKAFPTLIIEKKRKHSQKPDVMYKLIESKTIEPRIELFARQRKPGWNAWGDQLPNFEQIEIS